MFTFINMKVLLFLSVALVGLSSCGNAQNSDSGNNGVSVGNSTYDAWKKEALTEIRLNPKYGHAIKSAAQKEADDKLINIYLKDLGTRRKGSDALITSGFDYLYKGNLRTAMYRFNQAWLLDSTNSDVFWGYASVYYTFKDYNRALRLLDEGLAINPSNAKIITDKGTIYFTKYHSSNDKDDLNKGVELLTRSYTIDPLNQNTLYKLSVCYFLRNDCEMAKRYFLECKRLGGKPITDDFTKAILTKCR
jgi:tetratricopeptide (TPR) repeat protein